MSDPIRDLEAAPFVLYNAEMALPRLIAEREAWKSLYIDYHPPVVERVWRDYEGCRLSLHRIHPCGPGEAFRHPHKWPGVFRVWGRYQMGLGWSDTLQEPSESVRIITASGMLYHMTDPNVWHYVRPLEEPVLTVMVTGLPWEREMPLAPSKPLSPLSTEAETLLFEDVLRVYEEEYQ